MPRDLAPIPTKLFSLQTTRTRGYVLSNAKRTLLLSLACQTATLRPVYC